MPYQSFASKYTKNSINLKSVQTSFFFKMMTEYANIFNNFCKHLKKCVKAKKGNFKHLF